MTTTSRFIVPLNDTATAAFCARTCGVRWCLANNRSADEVQFQKLSAPSVCRHCNWCARIIPTSILCVWHGQDCPEFRWDITFAGAAAVKELVKRARVPELPQGAWDCLDYVWDHQDKPDPVSAVYEVWSRRDVWMNAAS